MSRLRARIHAQRPKGPRSTLHSASTQASSLLRPCQIARTWRTLGAHKPPPRVGPTMVVARQPRITGQCSGARVTLKSLMLFGRRYVAHCLPLAPEPAELELDPPLSTSTSQAFDTFCCKYLEPPLLGSFISISRLCASSTSASVAVGFTLRIMRAWVARKGNKQLALMRCCTALATTSGGGGTRTSLSSKPPRPDRKPALAAFAAADAPPLSGAFT